MFKIKNKWLRRFLGLPNNTVPPINTTPIDLHQAYNALLQQNGWATNVNTPGPPLTITTATPTVGPITTFDEVVPEVDWGEPTTITWAKKKAMTDTKDQEEFYNQKLSRLIPFRTGKHKGLVGLEIECEGKNLSNTIFNYWLCHEDGSLRATDGHPPIEYVLREPMDVKEVYTALKYLEGKFKEAGSSVVKSNRTSVHVHVNCQDWTLKQIYNYILLYLVFEEILVDWSGPERAGNLFCLRAKDSDYIIQMLETVLKQKRFQMWREEMRYSACNVASLCKFGSLEFRSLRGTVDVDLIMTWIEMLLTLRDKSLTYDNPVEIIDEFMRIGPIPFFRQVFYDEKLRNLLADIPDLSGKMWSGLRMSRDVAKSIPEWKKALPKKKESTGVDQEKNEAENGETPRVKHGDTIATPWGTYIVRGREADGNTYRMVNYDMTWQTTGAPFQHVIPAGMTMYYINTPGFNGNWLLLDQRPGVIEYA